MVAEAAAVAVVEAAAATDLVAAALVRSVTGRPFSQTRRSCHRIPRLGAKWLTPSLPSRL
jgi:hypothetical protein